jgi:hypothetical protein
MKNYIFYTSEGFTFQPKSESIDPNIENCQILGWTNGKNPKEAFKNLKEENNFLKKTTFNEVICQELANTKKFNFYLQD